MGPELVVIALAAGSVVPAVATILQRLKSLRRKAGAEVTLKVAGQDITITGFTGSAHDLHELQSMFVEAAKKGGNKPTQDDVPASTDDIEET